VSADVLQTISIVAFILGAVLAIVAVILWFRLNVRGIIDDLSGKKAERQIRELREQNKQEESDSNKGRVVYNPSTGKSTSKLGKSKKNDATDKLTEPLKLVKKKGQAVQEDATALLQEEEGTVVLDTEEGTTVLEQEVGTTVLENEEGTTVLSADEEGTTVLGNTVVQLQNGYRMVLNEIVIHTKERI